MELYQLIFMEEKKMGSTKQLLEDEIRSEIEEISNMELGSDNHKKTTDNLVKLLDKYNDMTAFYVYIRIKTISQLWRVEALRYVRTVLLIQT